LSSPKKKVVRRGGGGRGGGRKGPEGRIAPREDNRYSSFGKRGMITRQKGGSGGLEGGVAQKFSDRRSWTKFFKVQWAAP